MTLSTMTTLRAAMAALVCLPIASAGVLAQEAQDDSTTMSESAGSSQAGADNQDTLLATVGDAEIRGSDVMTVIGMLPPELAAQPPDMLIPMAMEQLILRELILAEARRENLAEDPEVIALVEGSMQGAEEDALVQVWIDREMANTVSEEAVQQAYSDLQAQSEQDVPPLEQLRPQIEQFLRQQAMRDIAYRLQEGAEIVLYDAAGQPIDRETGAAGGATDGQATDGEAGGQTEEDDAEGTGASDDN